jgi:hypothetical protein
VKSISASLICFVMLWVASARAAVDGGAVDSGGPTPCGTTDECSPPTSYCNTTLGKCVQCIADLNCFGVGLVCNVEKGVCVNCKSHGDCFGDTPYCSSALGQCVECVADGNCGNQGVKCTNGVCGSCGDGICSVKERSGAVGLCKDCFQNCPKTDLKSKVGDKVASGTVSAGSEAFMTSCGTGIGETATFKWTAPETAAYAFDGGGTAYVSLLMDDCAGPALACFGGPASSYFSAGQQIAILVNRFDGATGPFTLGIRKVDQVCNPMFCPFSPSGSCCTADGSCGTFGPSGACGHYDGGLDPTSNCIANAKARGDSLCMQGTYCSCSACPSLQDACGFEKGCLDVMSCMAKFNCTDKDCYSPDRCASIIDSYGGPNSLAYLDATSLASCDRASGCTLDCTNQPPFGTSGTGGFTSGTGGRPPIGRGGSSGFVGTGGTGATSGGFFPDAGLGIERPDGGFKKGATSGGCDCTVANQRSSGWATLGAVAFLALACARRKKRLARN